MSERYNALDLKARTSATIQGASEAVEALQQCGVAAAHVHNGRTLAEDPHLAQRGVYDEVEHGFWLEQTDFVAQVITIHADGHATVDWGEAWAFSDQADEPESEQCVLRMACSFADPSLQVGLGEVRCLDHRNLHLIQGALYTTMFGPDAPATE